MCLEEELCEWEHALCILIHQNIGLRLAHSCTYVLKLYHLPNVVGAWCNCHHGIACVLQGEEGTQGPVGEKGDTGDKGDMVSCHCYLYLCVHVYSS